MLRSIIGRSFLVVALASVCTVAIAQKKSSTASSRSGKTSEATTSESESTTAKSTSKSSVKQPELKGRLPRYFASLVDRKQRQEVYEIQASYREKVEALEKQLAELRDAEMASMEKVLTATQRKKLSEMRSAAEKSASKSTSTQAKPASSKSSAKTNSTSSNKSSSKK